MDSQEATGYDDADDDVHPNAAFHTRTFVPIMGVEGVNPSVERTFVTNAFTKQVSADIKPNSDAGALHSFRQPSYIVSTDKRSSSRGDCGWP